MKIRRIAAILVFVAAATAFASGGARADSGDLGAEFAALEAQSVASGDPWYALAVKAREAGDTAVAGRALDEAERLEYSPARIGLERARLQVMNEDPEGATEALQQLADGGFTAVGVITADPLLSTLAGQPAFDALVATMSVAAYPCEHDDRFREFDFWIGQWEVHDGNGQFAGRNMIERAHEGCVLVENWTSASGGTGMSMNYLDHATGEWVQIWIDSSGGQIEIRGGMTEAGMQLTGQIHYTANDTTAPFRGLWTPLPDGRVRQFFEQSGDDGETWQTWFEGFYSRLDAPAR